MGLRFRKSFNLGCGVRINISNSGVGYSVGCRGFRRTYSSNGRTTQTVSIPGTGLSYTTSRNRNSSAARSAPTAGLGATVSTSSVDIDNFRTAADAEILKKLENALLSHRIATVVWIALSMFLLYIHSVWMAILFAVGTIAVIFVLVKVAIDLDYELDYEQQQNYDSYCQAWHAISSCKDKRHQLSLTTVTNRRLHSNASAVVNSKPFTISSRLPMWLKINVPAYCIELNGQQLIILPDKILIVKGSKIGSISYDDLSIVYSKQSLICDRVFSDCEKIDETYTYTNKNGSRDKRYSNNPKKPVCLYGKISMTASGGFEVVMLISNNKIIDKFQGK